MTEDEVEIGRITVTRSITSDPNEGDAIDVDIPGELSVLDALGMLELAKQQVLKGQEDE